MLIRDTSSGFISDGNQYQFQSEEFQGPAIGENYYRELLQRQKKTPVIVFKTEDIAWWMFGERFYCEDEGYTVEQVKFQILELESLEHAEIFNEKMDTDFLNSLSMDHVKEIISIRNHKIHNLYNDLYKEGKKEYDDWVLKGKTAVEQAAKEFLKPGEDIKKLEEFIGEIPADFIGGGGFESSQIYKKWSPRIKEATRRLENAKKILGAKAREKFGFPDIPVEQEESPLNTEWERTGVRRDVIPDDVKMFVWNRDGGKCVRCGSQEKLEYDHIIPLSRGGSSTARNIQLLCEKCNRSKGGSIV